MTNTPTNTNTTTATVTATPAAEPESADNSVSDTRPQASGGGAGAGHGAADQSGSGTRPQASGGGAAAGHGAADQSGSGTRPVTGRLVEIISTWARSHWELVVTAAELADGNEWFLDGAPTPAAWLAAAADVEACTAREWIRIGRCLQSLPAIADAFKRNTISYSKVRALTRLADTNNETELLAIAEMTPAGELAKALAAWLNRNADPEDIDRMQFESRSVKWRTEPDGMVTFTLRLQPLIAAYLISFLTTWVMRSRPKPDPDQPWPTVAQQHADAIADLVQAGAATVDTEVVVHVRGDDDTVLADGTPITATALGSMIDTAFISAIVVDAKGDPIDATNRRRHPNRRQRRLIDARDPACVDCGRTDLLEYDHQPPFHQTHHTITTETQRRCAPCHDRRHASMSDPQHQQ